MIDKPQNTSDMKKQLNNLLLLLSTMKNPLKRSHGKCPHCGESLGPPGTQHNCS